MSGRVHQLLSGAGPYDAVTNQALAHRELMARWGVEGDVYAAAMDPAVAGRVRRVEELRVADDDVVVLHYSAHAAALERALEGPGRKLLVYHNVTPPEFLWEHEPQVAMLCALGRARLPRFAARADAAVAPSRFSAQDLREAGAHEVRVVPALYVLDRERLAPGAERPSPLAAGGPTIVFVGRLSHNKRQDRLVKAFALLQRHRLPDARLVLAGPAGSGSYAAHLERLARELGTRDVVLAGALPQDELNSLYASAAAFACLSEHEGFCLPLLEAMHFGLPVVARRAAAVPEVLGDAGVLLEDPDLPTVAEAIDLCVGTEPLRAEVRVRGERRLERFAPARTEAELREVVEALL
jgi:glycosyltransferase involved in cell wall biosynthesis